MTSKTKRPGLRERAREMICPECGGPVERKSAKGRTPTFCCKEHKIAHWNRHVSQGAVMAALIKAWRIDRGTGEIAKDAFAQICSIADQFNADDKQAGRPRADLYAAKLLGDGRIYIDRMAR